jgi:hypothetical protein
MTEKTYLNECEFKIKLKILLKLTKKLCTTKLK